MKKVYVVALTILLVTGLIFGGCAKPAPPPAPAWEWPESISCVTMPAMTPMYALTVAWGSVLEKETGAKVRVMPENLGPLRFTYVREGRHDMLTEATDGVVIVLEAVEAFATKDGGPFPARILWTCFGGANAIMVRGDSDIKTIYDLKPGVRWAIGPGPIQVKATRAWAAWAGLKDEEVQEVFFGDFVSAIRAVVDGKADVAASDPGAPWSFELEGSPHGIRWLDANAEEDPEGAARYLEVQPLADFGLPPQEGVVPSALGISCMVNTMFYIVQQSTDPELTYHLAKWLDENFDAYKGMHRGTNYMSIDTFRGALDITCLPVHKGTIKYLKEKGAWAAADDKRQAYNVELVNRYEEAYRAAIAAADTKGIKVDPMNEDWMNLWAEHKKDIPIFKTMTEIP